MTVHLERSYATEKAAHALVSALAADQPDYVRAKATGCVVRIEVAGATASSVRATLDDLLSCLVAAERTLGVTPARS
ncbi:MAG: hypothetical protein L3K09_01155 [Thermoplasmata archaeon]|nr:hypothetical protein [Thermoplasmata archaeon]